MNNLPYDLVVIGGGSGGLTSAIMAGRLGARVLLVDKTSLGGDCLHAGCVPSKALIASARMAHRMRHAKTFGLEAGEVRVDFPAVMDRLDRIRDEIGRGESPELLREEHGVEVAFGGARFTGPRTIAIGDDREVQLRHAVIAVGSRAHAPAIEGLAEAGFLTNETLFQLRHLPERLTVLGGGPIGVEMGQALSRLGAKVTIVQRGARLLPREEPSVAEAIREQLQREGIEVLTGAVPVRITREGEEKRCELKQDGAVRTLSADELLVAVGRRPNTERLGLDKAGIDANDKGIVVDDALRTTLSDVYAVGDCNGGPQFTHWAEYEARIATRNALFAGTERRRVDRLPWTTFCDPEVARVGLTEAEARARHEEVQVHEIPMSKVDRAVCEGNTVGFASVVVDDKRRILGVHIVGPNAGELLSEWVLAMNHDIRLDQIGASIHVYPTLSRANRRLADEQFFSDGVPGWQTRLFGRFDPLR